MSPTTLPLRTRIPARVPHVPDPRDKMSFTASFPFVAIHVLAIAGAILLPFKWWYPLLAIGLYYVRMFGVTAGYHRYFAHRAFKTGRVFQFLLAFLAETSVQKGVLWWSGHHRDHHRDSDTPADIHSPVQRGFWWSHVGWIMSPRFDAAPLHRIKDFVKYPELVFLSKHYWIPPTIFGVAIYLLGGWPAAAWGFGISTVLLWHGTFTINSLSHVLGKRRYDTADDSRNNWVLALVTMGEGWHNNHHHFAASARQGFFWWEIDMSYYVLKALSAVGLVWDLKQPTEKVLAEGRASDAAQAGKQAVPAGNTQAAA